MKRFTPSLVLVAIFSLFALVHCDSESTVDPTQDKDHDGETVAQGDCDDHNPRVNTTGIETPYDGVDQDCDGADLTDVDGDGADGVLAGGTDCDDRNAAVGPAATEVPYNGVDDDCNAETRDEDVDGDGFAWQGGGDCDDTDDAIYPGAKEIPYDGIDQDCSGKDLTDVDRDGYDSVQVDGGNDCDDQNPYVKPAGIEICGDQIDQDCSGADQDCGVLDTDGDGYSPNEGDCDDTRAAVNPNATETPYNGRDDDCDAQTPDDDLDKDGFAKVGGGDCDDDAPLVFPGADETPYDGIDQDCSGADLTDVDKDGYDALQVSGGTDCDDRDPKVHPDIEEVPYDNVDQDCDGDDLVMAGVFEAFTPFGTGPIAFDIASSGSQYLVVYRTTDSNDALQYQVIAQRLSAAGQPVGNAIVVHKSSINIGHDPAVASDGNDFLVVFVYKATPSTPYGLRGQRISQAGTLLGGQIVIRDRASNLNQPDVAYSKGNYTAVWRETVPVTTPYKTNYYLIRAQLIFGNGTLPAGTTQCFPVAPNDCGTLDQTACEANSACSWETRVAPTPVSGLSGNNMNPALGTNGNSDLLASWKSGTQIQGQLLSPYGGQTGSAIIISSASGTPANPTAAFDGQSYLVAWQDPRNGQLDIFGQRLTSTGTLVGSSVKVNLPISTALGVQKEPQLASCGQRFTTVFLDERFYVAPALFRQPVDSAGVLQDAAADDNDLFYASGNTVDTLLLSCNSDSLLALWKEEGRMYGVLIEP